MWRNARDRGRGSRKRARCTDTHRHKRWHNNSGHRTGLDAQASNACVPACIGQDTRARVRTCSMSAHRSLLRRDTAGASRVEPGPIARTAHLPALSPTGTNESGKRVSKAKESLHQIDSPTLDRAT
eukprot:3856421-Pleurochrysis_carterae.AAC.1